MTQPEEVVQVSQHARVCNDAKLNCQISQSDATEKTVDAAVKTTERALDM